VVGFGWHYLVSSYGLDLSSYIPLGTRAGWGGLVEGFSIFDMVKVGKERRRA